MRRKTGFLGGLAVAVALTGGGAGAQGTERLDQLFGQIDLNGDGTLTVREMRSAAAARFNALDVDGDGVVHSGERNGSRDSRLRLSFGQADRDGNGMLDAYEMQEVARQRANRRILQLDTNGDGMLSLQEMQRGEDAAAASGGTGTQALTLPALDAQMMMMFRQADRDANGIVTLNEAIAGAGR